MYYDTWYLLDDGSLTFEDEFKEDDYQTEHYEIHQIPAGLEEDEAYQWITGD